MASSCRDKLRTSGWRYGESQLSQWFNLLRHALKCLEEVVLDTGLDVPSFCRARCGQQQGGVRGRSYSPMWLKVFAFARRGDVRRKLKPETLTSFFLGCQRKSV